MASRIRGHLKIHIFSKFEWKRPNNMNLKYEESPIQMSISESVYPHTIQGLYFHDFHKP